MQFALQALPFSRYAQNDELFGHLSAAPSANAPGVAPATISMPGTPPALRLRSITRLPPRPPAAQSGVRILRNEGQSQGGEGGRLLISGRMADVCAALNRMAFNEYACG